MIVCLDTNTLIQAAKPGHAFSRILEAWVGGEFVWAVSSEILLEYLEVVVRQSGRRRWEVLDALMQTVAMTDNALMHVTPTFDFHVVATDPGDNKFCDCAIAAGADFVVTADADFAPLANSGYKPKPIVPQEFIARHLARR